MNKAGLKEAMYEAYTAGEKDYSALVSKLKSNNMMQYTLVVITLKVV